MPSGYTQPLATAAQSISRRSTPGRWSNDRHLICPPQGVHSSPMDGDFRFRALNGHQDRGSRLPLLTRNGPQIFSRSRNSRGFAMSNQSGLMDFGLWLPNAFVTDSTGKSGGRQVGDKAVAHRPISVIFRLDENGSPEFGVNTQ